MEKEQLVSLVTNAQEGDNEALNHLFNEFYNDLYYFALKTVKDDETALDVTQESFVEIINTLGNLKEPAAFVTWAKQITYHQCTRYFKKKKDVLVDEDEEVNTVFDTLKEENAEFIPDEALDKADFKKTVMAILDELSEEQRSAVMMYYFDEMSVKQIAEIQGVSEGTVKSRLNYARKAIKNSVEEYEKKHNIKLHAIPFFPFFKWIFDGMFEGSLPTASAEIVAEGVTTATGTAITVSTTTGTTAAVATTTTATAVGIGAKIAAMPLVTKIVAGIVAATIVIGGTTTAVLLSNDNNDDIPAGNQSIVSTNNGTTSTSSDTTTSDTNTNTSSESSSTDTTTSDGTSSTESSATTNNSSTNSTTDTSSTESTEEPIIIKLTKDSMFNGLTDVYTNNDLSSDFYGLLCKNSITLSFCPNGGTLYEDERTVSTPIVFLGFTYPSVYVPQDVTASPKYQHAKDMLMQWISRGDYNGIPTTATWEELFTNEAYFKAMDGIIHNGVKHILFTDSVGSPGDCYDYTMSDDGSITLIKNNSYFMGGCNYTLTNIKLDEDMKTLTATVTLYNGVSQNLTLKLI